MVLLRERIAKVLQTNEKATSKLESVELMFFILNSQFVRNVLISLTQS